MQFIRFMSSHPEITKHIARSPVVAAAKLLRISQETPNIKAFTFQISRVMHAPDAKRDKNDLSLDDFSFKPGQWIDLYPPQMNEVGGFSITSTPQSLARMKTFDLAVREAKRNPVVRWLHQKAQEGDEVQVRVGGNFFLRPNTKRALFIAGGVGLTPIFSMAQHVSEWNANKSTDEQIKAKLVYSVQEEQDVLFKDRIFKLNGVPVSLFVTRSKVSKFYGRLSKETINEHLKQVDAMNEGCDVYICGPAALEDQVIAHVENLKRPNTRIFYEEW